ncbi:MAG TPA: DNA recombination protein RmuC [Steroidobacteraceae bacterium]
MQIAYAVLGALLLGVIAALMATRLLGLRHARELADSEARLREHFRDCASAALRDNTDLFLKLARESFGREQTGMQGAWREREQALSALVDPIRSALEKTEAQVAAMERERREAFGTLRAQIETMALGQSTLQRETRNLVTALRRPEVRGRWGELTLRRVVELGGLSEHCDFTEQMQLETAGGAQRPDLVVHLPEGRDLVVDAKTPLEAYLEAIDAPTEELRAVALARHARQLEARIRELASKAYWTQFEHSPEFAVLFLPGDQFLSSALAERPELLDDALRTGVIVATPSTLIALLKAVAYGWRQVAVVRNAAEIRDLGQELHRRLASFISHFSKAGRQLGGAVEAYNSAVGSFERQVLPGARRFSELGAATGEALASPEPIEQPVREPLADRADAGPPSRA